MRTFVSLTTICSLDVDQLQNAFKQQVTIDDTDAGTSSDVQSGLVTLPGGMTSQAFSFGSVTSASLLVVIAYDEIQVQLGSNTAPLVYVRPTPAAPAAGVVSVYQREAQPGLLLLRGKVDSLFLTNPSGSLAASAFVAVVGNAT